MSIRRNLLGVMALVLASGICVFAQEQTQPTAPDGTRQERLERKERFRGRGERHKGMRGPRGMGHFMKGLNLSDAQREQMRAITQRRMESTKTQREELSQLREKRIAGTFTAEDEARAKTLHEEIRRSMEGTRAETEAILTAEQKAQFEQMKNERKARHEERKARHEQRLKERQDRLNKNPQ